MISQAYSVEVVVGDLPASISLQDRVSVDIETSGLDFRNDSIGSIQVFDGRTVWIIRPPFDKAEYLSKLISSSEVTKIFHHAMFDLRFLCSRFDIHPTGITCTKVAAKIADQTLSKHSLLILLKKYLGLELDKKLQTSNWMTSQLTSDQINYAARDTIYLGDLLDTILRASSDDQAMKIAASFEYLPYRLRLELDGIGDVYSY